jgi:23S rRNA (uracil1939-C5)-methyltransferase
VAQLVKGETTELEIQAAAYEGVGVGRVEELVVFVRGGVPGDRVRARVARLKRRFAEAAVEEVLRPSPERVEPRCPHFGVCGGCSWQNASYDLQLRFKREHVRDLFKRIGALPDVVVRPVIGSARPYEYRNKMEYTFGASRWLTQEEIAGAEPIQKDFALGLHIRQRFDKILDLRVCHLQAPVSWAILNETRVIALEQQWTAYDTRRHEGYLRNLAIRTSDHTGEVMVNLVTSESDADRMRLLTERLTAKFPGITTLINSVNSTRSPVAAGEEAIYFGPGTITERIGDLLFTIGPSSFLQPNTAQAERLYQVVSALAELSGSEAVLDLYCGLGGISLFLASQALEVIGVENHSPSVKAAEENATRNSIANCRFFADDAARFLMEFDASAGGAPDVVTLDPPRSGVHPDVCKGLLRLRPERIVYVSCNPATQARDLQALTEAYEIEVAQPVDMFPQTYHIENVVALRRRE